MFPNRKGMLVGIPPGPVSLCGMGAKKARYTCAMASTRNSFFGASGMRASIAKDKQVTRHSAEWASEYGTEQRGPPGSVSRAAPSYSRPSCLLFVGRLGFRLGLTLWFRLARGWLLRFTTL